MKKAKTRKRKQQDPRRTRRVLNSDEMYAMGFVELQEHADEDGWPYPDDDDEETTEAYSTESGFVRQT